jgi:hypothetical protein
LYEREEEKGKKKKKKKKKKKEKEINLVPEAPVPRVLERTNGPTATISIFDLLPIDQTFVYTPFCFYCQSFFEACGESDATPSSSRTLGDSLNTGKCFFNSSYIPSALSTCLRQRKK